MPIRGLLFDKDGTLFDFRRTWAAWAAQLLEHLAPGDTPRQQAMAGAIGFCLQELDFRPLSPVIAGTPAEVAALLLPFLPGQDLAPLVDLMNRLAEDVPLSEVVPLKPLLEGLIAKGYVLGLATNDAEAPARAHLSRSGIAEYFDFVAGCDSGFGAKPAAGQLKAFCRVTGLVPEEVAMIGDSTHDLHAAEAAGMTAVAVLTGIATERDLAPVADVVLRDIGGLTEWLPLR
ncbi:HAD family hydrolase [Falsigemmobacter faecalis]|uniref:phosphoglycolate phosphatase n=1 Tax=Falsigemmobacter faecalis TaxID=2488730 RepID=A0A3P3DWD4_9RHOB|nr:HAD family hydrolase [Falsigemmobacter faecalis]